LVTFTVTEQFAGTDDASDGLDLFFTNVVHTYFSVFLGCATLANLKCSRFSNVDWEPRTAANICTTKYTPNIYNKQK
jgi:hypothetical protein